MVYIAGSITNCKNYEDRFEKAEKYLCNLGYDEIINPVKFAKKLPNYPKLAPEIYYNITTALLKECDMVYLLKNWNKSLGARNELKYALENGYQVITEE